MNQVPAPIRARAAVVLAGLLFALLGTTAGSPVAAQEVESERFSGPDRYETAAVAADRFEKHDSTTVTEVLLASGVNFPDAIAAGGLAGHLRGPVMLTRPDRVPSPTLSVLNTLAARAGDATLTVHILGGTAAVSAAVAAELAAEGYAVERIAGDNRFGTAAGIAETIGAANIGTHGGLRTVIITTGLNFPDALSAGPLGFSGPFPTLFVRATEVPAETSQAIADLGIEQVIIAGGSAVVSADVQTQLETETGNPAIRLEGPNRFATAAEIGRFLVPGRAFTGDDVLLAYGLNFPDALAAGPFGGLTRSPVLLTASLPAETRDWLIEFGPKRVRLFGGTAVISEETRQAAVDAATEGQDD